MTTPNESRPRDPNDAGWHLDKKVPLAFILTIIVQTVGVTWYFGKQDARISLIEQSRVERIAAQRERDGRQDQDVSESMHQLRAQLDKIDTKLDRVNDKLSDRK
jgi:hypothetical protein